MSETAANNQVRFTKIVATVAGDSCTREFLQELFERGMNVVRMNSAHMTIEEMDKVIRLTREVSPYLAVMLDTKGPNIRTCDVPSDGIPLQKGDVVTMSGTKEGSPVIQVNYPAFVSEVPIGSQIICDDGSAKFSVTGKQDGMLQVQALFDCVVNNKKSVNVPNVSLKAPALTEKDRIFLAEAVKMKCDFIAHSFVRNASDVREVRQALGEAGKEIGIIAKIENREGVDNIQEILKEADGIMVARGDLGIEIPLEEVPAIQKMLIFEARKMAKPVITATQMLQSMETSPLPTRAEVSDVANAVYDGTDAVMLSGETSHGIYPREAVEMMRKIVMQAEAAPSEFFTELSQFPDQNPKVAFLLESAVQSAQQLPVKAIICGSLAGVSARVLSALRPRVPVFAPTPNANTMRKLALSYGVFATISNYAEEPLSQVLQALEILESILKIDADDLFMLLTKNSHKVSRNNILVLATWQELMEGDMFEK